MTHTLNSVQTAVIMKTNLSSVKFVRKLTHKEEKSAVFVKFQSKSGEITQVLA